MRTQAELATLERRLDARLSAAPRRIRGQMGGTQGALEAVRTIRRAEAQRRACHATRRRIHAAALATHMRHRRALAGILVVGFGAYVAAAAAAMCCRNWPLCALSAGLAASVVGWARWLAV